MSNNKQSSIEWLINKCACADLRPELWNIIKEQAKEMHKQEIIDAVHLCGYIGGATDEEAEQYYNDTFGGNNE